MRLIETATDIRAPAARIWSILTDFPAYPAWNPFITAAVGELRLGARLKITIAPTGHRPMTFRPVVLALRLTTSCAGLVGCSCRDFSMASTPLAWNSRRRTCRFLHAERFSGVLLPFIGKQLFEATRQGFEAMNTALKQRAETS
jgi:hypothetical protein